MKVGVAACQEASVVDDITKCNHHYQFDLRGHEVRPFVDAAEDDTGNGEQDKCCPQAHHAIVAEYIVHLQTSATYIRL